MTTSKKIRIETKSSKIITVTAEVTDWIDNSGNQSATANYKGKLYIVDSRDSEGAIFCRATLN